MRLIDADAIPYRDYLGDDEPRAYKSQIDATPTIDAVPVVRGEWVDFAGDFQTAECNKCGELYDASDHADEKHFAAFKQFYNYCPSCGAKMEVEHDN